MKKWFISGIAIISAFTLTTQVAPLGALAKGNLSAPAKTSAGVPEEIPVGGGGWELPAIQYEETSLREENGKHFRLENGTMLAVSYPQPVHYQDEDGGWQEYDNTLVDAPALLSAENGEDPDGQVGPVNSDKTVRLSKKAKKNMFTLSDDGGTLTWGYLGTNKSALELVRQEPDQTNLSEPEKANDRFLNLQNTVQEGWYRDLYEGVDLQVLVTPRGLKENLILKNSSARRRRRFCTDTPCPPGRSAAPWRRARPHRIPAPDLRRSSGCRCGE